MSGVGLGFSLIFPWFQNSIDPAGWRQRCWVMAALMMLVVFPLNLLLQRHRPEDLGLRPDGDDPAGNPAAGDGGMGRASEKPSREVNWTLRQALGSPAFWWIAVGYFCGLVIWYMVQVHQTKYLLDLGIGTEVAAYALGLVGVTGSIGLIGLGYISDRLGRELAWTVASLGFAGGYAVRLAEVVYSSPWPR